jgi:hypothetical protein
MPRLPCRVCKKAQAAGSHTYRNCFRLTSDTLTLCRTCQEGILEDEPEVIQALKEACKSDSLYIEHIVFQRLSRARVKAEIERARWRNKHKQVPSLGYRAAEIIADSPDMIAKMAKEWPEGHPPWYDVYTAFNYKHSPKLLTTKAPKNPRASVLSRLRHVSE